MPDADVARRSDLPPAAQMQERLRALAYRGEGSVREAADLREQAAAVADVARRAGVDEVEYALVARDAERALGRMLEAGREAGDVAGQGNMRGAHLSDLRIERHLAAEAVAFAEVPDGEWETAVAHARQRGNGSRAGVRRVLCESESWEQEIARRSAAAVPRLTEADRGFVAALNQVLAFLADVDRGEVDPEGLRAAVTGLRDGVLGKQTAPP